MKEGKTKRCPYCDNEVRLRAVKCQFCGEWFDERPSSEVSPSGSYSGGRSGSHPSTPSGHTPLTGIHLVNQALGDRYEILEEIGRGGMATVYKAIQKSLERTVALKVVHQNLLHDTEFVARFHREAKLCASLNHPNIVHVYDEGEVSGVHFMAMEYLEGTDLHRLIRSRGRLTPQQTLQYLLPVAEALDYAHGRGLIHRDIKSANIFITGSGRAVLMDFGIAHATAGTQLTRAGTVIGTPEYMSPEQAEGKKVDHRTDLYSLGVVMYECLAGRVPFSGENAMSTIFQLTRNEPDDKPLVQSPASIRQLVTALLRKMPANRPVSARAVAEGMKLLKQGKQWQPPAVSSTEASSGSKSTAEQTQEPQTVKLGEKPGRARSQAGATSQGRLPKEKKKVPAAVWFLALLGLVLVFVVVHQLNVRENPMIADYESFTDIRDGQSYKTIQIGSQVWMAENLAYIPNQGTYDFLVNDLYKYGVYYNLQTAMEVCPVGWLLPKPEDWYELINFVMLNNNKDPITALKATTGWDIGSRGQDDYGFNILPSGYRSARGGFNNLGSVAKFWSNYSVRFSEGENIGGLLFVFENDLSTGIWWEENLFPVRCIRDRKH